MAFLKRLKKEYMELRNNPPPGVSMDDSIMEDNLTKSAIGILYIIDSKLACSLYNKYSFLTPFKLVDTHNWCGRYTLQRRKVSIKNKI